MSEIPEAIGSIEEFTAELRERAQWLSDRHRVADCILMQRSATKLELFHSAFEQLHGPLSVAALTARAEQAEAERDLLRQAVVRYCDHRRMGTVEPMSVQQVIDDAFASLPTPLNLA